jgi:hypothetical protein
MDRPTQVLFVELADHFEAIARTLRRFGGARDPQVLLPSDADPPGSSEATHLDPEAAVAKAKTMHPLLGSHQELVIWRLTEAHPEGLSVSQINPNASTQPNTYMTLDKLAELRMVRRDDQTHPRRYYLGPRMVG